MFCWGIGDFLIQRTVRKIGNVESLGYIGVIGTIFLLPFVLPELQLVFEPQNALFLFVLGVVTFFIAVIDFEALKQGKLSVVIVVLAVEMPITILLGLVFFRENISFLQFFLIGIIFFGIILTSVSSFSKKLVKNLEKGVLFAFVGAIGMAVVNFLTAAGSKTISPLMAIWVPWVVFTLISLAYLFQKKKLGQFVENGLKFKKLVLAMGVFDTLAWLFFSIAVFGSGIDLPD